MFLSVDELFPGFGGRAEPAGVASGCGAEDGYVAVHLRPDVAASRGDEFVPIRAFAQAADTALCGTACCEESAILAKRWGFQATDPKRLKVKG